MTWNDPRTWVAGEKPPAATMNAHIRDNFKAIGDPWTSYTPTWTGNTTNPVLNNGTLQGRYVQAGKLVIFRVHLVIGSTTTLGTGFYSFAVPANGIEDLTPVGTVVAFDTSAAAFTTSTAWFGSATVDKVRLGTAGEDGVFNNITPYAWATGDEINVCGMYEAA